MKKQKVYSPKLSKKVWQVKSKNKLFSLHRVLAGLAIITLCAAAIGGPIVRADRFDDQINSLNQQNAQNKQTAKQLMVQATSYQDAVNKLGAQINAIQLSIDTNSTKQAQIKQQIAEAEAELARQKQMLGETIKQIYLEGQITTLEMLASSKDLSDFVDKQQYRSTIQNKIKDTLDKITALKAELKNKEAEVGVLLKSEMDQHTEIASNQAEQAGMLAYTEGQRATYNQQIRDNNNQIASLRQQQIEENRRAILSGMRSGVKGGGGYPGIWAYADQDSMIDDWGMYNRECVSYTAWKVAVSGRYMPYWGGIGNANQWPANARAYGIPMDYGSGARVGDIAVSTAGPYGHSMYVEAVNNDGTVTVSQYNQFLDGTYSVNTRYASNLYFIHFQ